jgi:hypothetical protein
MVRVRTSAVRIRHRRSLLERGTVSISMSFDRDTPCSSAMTTASATCNSVSGTTALEWTSRFLSDLGI